MLSDWSFMHPHKILQRMKQQGGVFNYQRQTIAGLFAGRDQTLKERVEWAKMAMDPTNISDVTGAAYTYRINGHGPKDNRTACSSRASGCGFASSTPERRPSSTSAFPG